MEELRTLDKNHPVENQAEGLSAVVMLAEEKSELLAAEPKAEVIYK